MASRPGEPGRQSERSITVLQPRLWHWHDHSNMTRGLAFLRGEVIDVEHTARTEKFLGWLVTKAPLSKPHTLSRRPTTTMTSYMVWNNEARRSQTTRPAIE